MAPATPDVVTLELPDDDRYLGVAIVTVEALAMRAGVDKDEITALHHHVEVAFATHFGKGPPGSRVVVRYEVGDGFLGLGLRLLDGAGTTRGVTS